MQVMTLYSGLRLNRQVRGTQVHIALWLGLLQKFSNRTFFFPLLEFIFDK